MKRLRVGINLLFLGEASGGVGRYASELVGALAERDDVELEVIATRDAIPVLQREPWNEDVNVRIVPFSRAARAPYILATYAGLPAWALRRRIDILHSPANIGPIVSPGVTSVITVHDLIWSHAGRDWGTDAEIKTMRRTTSACIHRADRLITDSVWTRGDIVQQFGVPEARIDVVQCGVRGVADSFASEVDGLRSRLGLEGRRIILCVAQKRPYKRHEVVIGALPSLPVDVVAVLPGASTPYEDDLRGLATRLGVADRVIFPPWLPDADLDALYNHASICVFPSIYEGFGLPILEAMMRGVPVACSDRAALPEVAGDAALFFDPDDQPSVDAALRRLLEDERLRNDLIDAGRCRAAEFTWARTAEETIKAYRRAHAAP